MTLLEVLGGQLKGLGYLWVQDMRMKKGMSEISFSLSASIHSRIGDTREIRTFVRFVGLGIAFDEIAFDEEIRRNREYNLTFKWLFKCSKHHFLVLMV